MYRAHSDTIVCEFHSETAAMFVIEVARCDVCCVA